MSACGPSDGGGADCVAGLLPGDLVITEIMANPDGADDGNEWFEIYNNTGSSVDLRGLALKYVSGSGTESTHVMGAATIPSGAYLVLGGILPEFAPAHVDYGFASDLGSLGNTGGRLALICDVIEVDAVDYADMPSGRSRELSRSIFPDHNENDDWANWCDGVSVFAGNNLGSPGAANECTAGSSDGMCLDNGSLRPVRAPVAGDLVITEFMPNPAAVADADGEWFEVKATRDIDLNGVTIGRDPLAGADAVFDEPDCRSVSAGSYLLFAKNPESAANGGLPAADMSYSFSLVNSGGSLFVGYGAEVLDQVTWASSTSGASTNLDPDACDTRLNDDPVYFCPSSDAAYGAGDLGTPGAGNQQCPDNIPPGFCIDPVSGAVRDIVAPRPGDLFITEFMADPAGMIADTQGEWIEVRADSDIDLNGLEIRKVTGTGTTGSSIIDSTMCIRATTGSYQVFVHTGDIMLNGCLGSYAGLFDVSLNNSNNTIYITKDGVDIDMVTYTSTSAGSSSSLDENSGVWCSNTTDVYDSCVAGENTGTPGSANPVCP